MTLVELLIAFDRLPPEMWDVVAPRSQLSGRSLDRVRNDARSLNGQPTPPADPHLAAVELVGEIVRTGSIAESIAATGAEVIRSIIDDWCGTGWPHWPFPVPVGPGGEPHPDWSAATAQLVGAFALASTAARMSPGPLREAAEQGANQLFTVSQR